MTTNMGKIKQKTRPPKQNSYTVAPRKTPKMAGNTRAGEPVKRPKKRRSPKLPVCLTIPEKDRFFKAIKSPRDRAIFGLCYFHGLRASEIGRLAYSDFRQGTSLNLDRLRISRLKGSVSGEYGIVPTAAQMLRSWVRRRGIEPGPLFPSRQKGPISRYRIFALMRRYCEIAAIPAEKRHPHALRHSTAIHLLSDKRESLMDVQRHLGHRDIKSTMVYLGALSDEFNEARIRRLATWK
jgi:integrase